MVTPTWVRDFSSLVQYVLSWSRIIYDPRLWGFVLAVVELNQASSYFFRPPPPVTQTSRAIEALIPYDIWSFILVVSGCFIIVGTAFTKRRLARMAHLAGLFCYLTFGWSVVMSAVALGAGWAGAGPFFVVALLHFGRMIRLSDELAEERKVRADDG